MDTAVKLQPFDEGVATSLGNGTVDAPLCVDLDQTLISSDLLWESAMLMLRHRPLESLWMPVWALQGKAQFKRKLAERVQPDPRHLPYRSDVLAFMTEEHDRGRRLVLATASDARLADGVAEHLGLFDEVIASDGIRNVSGGGKREALVARFGNGGFDYIGDSPKDKPVWGVARNALVVGSAARARRLTAGSGTLSRTFEPARNGLAQAVKALRPRQWVKNLLVGVPVITAHNLHWGVALRALLAFIIFSACASAVYLLNDLLDIEADRQHPTKRRRPFAAGTVSIPAGLGMFVALLAAAFGAAPFTLGIKFTAMLGAYFGLTLVYSLYLKKKLLLDIILLALLYTQRIIAGGAAVHITVSPWLLAFAMFFFLSLAFAKRYSELKMLEDRDERHAKGRCYMVDDLAMIESCGPSAGYMAVLVLCLYINSPVAVSLYRQPAVLWALCPILLYWITRIWFLARRRMLTDDPIAFAVRDRVSLIAAFLLLCVMAVATFLP